MISHSIFPGIFPTQRFNPGLLHCRQILYQLSHKESPRILEWAAISFSKELHKKDLHDPYNHDGVITHLEPDILECKVKWALGSITTNKASGGDGIPVELFQILKMMLFKCCTQYASKFSSKQRSAKCQFSF